MMRGLSGAAMENIQVVRQSNTFSNEKYILFILRSWLHYSGNPKSTHGVPLLYFAGAVTATSNRREWQIPPGSREATWIGKSHRDHPTNTSWLIPLLLVIAIRMAIASSFTGSKSTRIGIFSVTNAIPSRILNPHTKAGFIRTSASWCSPLH